MAWEYATDTLCQEELTPLKAIRAKCIDCSGGSVYEPANCTIKRCPLYIYREGHNPKRRGVGKVDNISINKKTAEPTQRKGNIADKEEISK